MYWQIVEGSWLSSAFSNARAAVCGVELPEGSNAGALLWMVADALPPEPPNLLCPGAPVLWLPDPPHPVSSRATLTASNAVPVAPHRRCERAMGREEVLGGMRQVPEKRERR